MHKCVRCGATYEDNDDSILKGCPSCGSIFFLYFKNERQMEEAKEIEEELKKEEKAIEKEIKQVEKKKKAKEREFGIETIRIKKEGVYEINLKGLMQDKPIIVLEKGKIYLIHLPSLFEKAELEQPLSSILEDFFP
jgi:predicted  nucleic acid-binding Zn-ribbon protein